MIAQEKVAVIVGPTAVGKTELSIRVADLLNGEIISGDSMQVYRGMDIGTAKIQADEMTAPSGRRIPHHMIDIISPDAPFSVADFQKITRNLISEINSRGRLPILVGGTGLYVNAALDPYYFTEMAFDGEFRRLMKEEAKTYGSEKLHHELKRIDPVAAGNIHPNDSKRIIRALEVYHATGRPLSQLREEGRENETGYRAAIAGVSTAREILYRRINQRVDKMLAAGLVEEVEGLIRQGFEPGLNSMQGLGYRQIAAYLRGILTIDEAVNLIKRDTRHFAKRQLTWFHRDERIHWFDPGNSSNNGECAREIASFLGRTLGIAVE